MNETWLWLSCDRFTVAVRISHGRVTQGPPLVKRFLGQPEQNLVRWFSRQPGFTQASLS